MAAHCGKCGAAWRSGNRFCVDCGAPQELKDFSPDDMPHIEQPPSHKTTTHLDSPDQGTDETVVDSKIYDEAALLENCPSCAAPWREGGAFCTKCGFTVARQSELTGQDNTQHSAQPITARRVWLIFVTVAVAIAIVVWLAFGGQQEIQPARQLTDEQSGLISCSEAASNYGNEVQAGAAASIANGERALGFKDQYLTSGYVAATTIQTVGVKNFPFSGSGPGTGMVLANCAANTRLVGQWVNGPDGDGRWLKVGYAYVPEFALREGGPVDPFAVLTPSNTAPDAVAEAQPMPQPQPAVATSSQYGATIADQNINLFLDDMVGNLLSAKGGASYRNNLTGQECHSRLHSPRDIGDGWVEFSQSPRSGLPSCDGSFPLRARFANGDQLSVQWIDPSNGNILMQGEME